MRRPVTGAPELYVLGGEGESAGEAGAIWAQRLFRGQRPGAAVPPQV